MLAHPILINRPIVVTEKGVKLCRPSDIVLYLLPQAPVEDVRKEDGVPLLRDVRVPGDDPALSAALRAAALPMDDLAEPGAREQAHDREPLIRVPMYVWTGLVPPRHIVPTAPRAGPNRRCQQRC
jgi:hypothetical protein